MLQHSQWAVTQESAANTAQTLTQAAASGQSHYVSAFEVGLRAAAAGNDVAIELRAGATVIWRSVLGSGAGRGERVGVVFSRPLFIPRGTAVNLVVPAAGAGCITYACVAGYSR
jgi:hypothetical protein